MQPEVIVVGAGPAGCAAAISLARQGRRVLLLERASLPQPKTCGDGLLPQALRALDELGVGGKVRSVGLCLNALEVTSPGGRTVRVELASFTLPRKHLHQFLQEEASLCGVELMTGEASGPLVEGDRIVGVNVRRDRQPAAAIRAPLVILACGARAGTLRDFGVCLRNEPSAVGIRAYFRGLSGEVGDALHISYDRNLFPGYGWVFPLPDGLYNIGCGRFLRHPGEPQPDLHQLFEYFLRSFPPARAIASQDGMLGVPCGGLLRTGLSGAMGHRPGLLVAGEAFGTTLPFTGEGVGMALLGGMAAARIAGESLRANDASAPFLARYTAEMEAHYRPLYLDFQRAQGWLAVPRLIDLLAWQASRRPLFRAALGEMLAGTVSARAVFSLSGLLGRPGRAGRRQSRTVA